MRDVDGENIKGVKRMTKRFTLKGFDGVRYDLFDGDVELAEVHKEDAKELCNLLNELAEENDELNNTVDSWVQTADFYLQKVYGLRTSVFNIKKEYENLKKENDELKSIKRFAEKNGINIFKIDEAFRRCWKDNGKLVKENNELQKHNELMEKTLDDISERLAEYRNKWVDL